MGLWFEEQLEVSQGRIFKVKCTELIESVRSAFQKIDVYETVSFGKMLVHDDVIMVTEKDEAHYHEMIVHVALNTHPRPERVLVIGGGDGGTMREVLRHPEVRQAHLCEIDPEVVRVCRKHFPALACSFDDPRAELFFADGAEFIRTHKAFYDVIIVDSSDPVGPAEVLFRKEFYQEMFHALRPDGVAVTQSESFQYHAPVIAKVAAFSREIFPVYRYFYAMVPTYPSGLIGFSFCSKKYDPLVDFIEPRAEALKGLSYYNPGIHHASFVLPEFTRAFL
jgi:spermidine synthase